MNRKEPVKKYKKGVQRPISYRDGPIRASSFVFKCSGQYIVTEKRIKTGTVMTISKAHFDNNNESSLLRYRPLLYSCNQTKQN